MFNYKMDLRSYFICLHVIELLLFIAAIITYGIYLSYMLVLFGIRIFNLFKYIESMSLISLILQHYCRCQSKSRGQEREVQRGDGRLCEVDPSPKDGRDFLSDVDKSTGRETL
jgi:hypothetical protein